LCLQHFGRNKLFYLQICHHYSLSVGKWQKRKILYLVWFRHPISMTNFGHRYDFKLDNQRLKSVKYLHTKKALLLNHSNIFSKLVVCTETTSPQKAFFYKIQTKYKLIKMIFSFLIVIKLLIPMWWHWNLNKINLVCVYVYNLKVSNFQIGHRFDLNRKWSIFWNWTGRRFQRLEIRLVAKISCWNQMSKSALTVLCHIFLWITD